MSLTTFVAILSVATLARAIPLSERGAKYQIYTGDGTSWPSTSDWVSYETMWSSNQDLLSSSCSQYGQANNSPDEIKAIDSAVKAQASSSGVDPRLILATILQESGGCVRVPTSNGGVVNPGLMQTHAGSGTCASTNPCPSSMITQMVTDGASGTAAGDGLKQCIAQAKAGGASDATAVYRAARIYNTGTYVAGSDLGTPEWGTSCYSSDIANRLTGWSGLQTQCTLPNPQH